MPPSSAADFQFFHGGVQMIKQLAKCVGQYKKQTILTPAFVALEVVMEVVIPLVMASLIDKGIDAGDMGYIVRIGLVLLGCAALSMLFGVLSGYYAAESSAGFARNLRRNMFYNVQNFSFSNIDKFSTASIVTRLTTDVTNVQMAFMMITRIAVRCPLMLVFSLIMSFGINVKISVIFLCAMPVLALGLYLITTHAHPIFERVFKTYDKLNNVVQENLRGVRVVKSFVREDYEREKFGKVSKLIFEDFSKAERTIAFGMPLMQTAIYACSLLAAWIGARLIVGGSMTTGQLMSVMTYAMQILMSMMMLSMVFVMIVISRASCQRVCEILAEESNIKNGPDPVTEVADGSIEFSGAGFSYQDDPARLCLKNIDLTIRSGETIGILGGTGASKSTLVQLIPRLYDTTVGSVKVGGVDVRDYDLRTLRDAVAMVLQKNELFSGTIKDNLRWGCENATDEEMVEACRLAQADEFVREMPDGYDTHIEQGGTNVSGGQKQRLCIARALLKKPKILILDDSTSAVDTRTDALIRRGFREYIPETTKLIIAQRVSSVQDADRIIVLDNGEIADVGSHEELLGRCAIYQEVYLSQQKD